MNPSSHVSSQAVEAVSRPNPKLNPPMAELIGAAAAVLASVIDGQTPDAVLQAQQPSIRAGAMDLSYTALRDYGRGDFILAKLLAKPLPDKLAHSLLLVAISRLERRPDEAHTIVNQTTEAAATVGNGRYKGVVNGVLRNFLRRRDELIAAADADSAGSLRYPAWWIRRVRADHPQTWQAILDTGNAHPPMCLRLNQRRVTSTNWRTNAAGAELAIRELGEFAFLLERPIPVDRIPGFANGECSVQDFGAQLAAHLLDVTDGMSVLDACAAPGGKAAHLLELADIDLTAIDLDPRRIARVEANLTRLGLSARVCVGDAAKPDAWWNGRPFERILADVPCSASGVVRRHPDAKWLRRETDVAKFSKQQAKIIDALWQTLSPGGKMLYATCSVFDQENESQILSFVQRHADAVRLPTTLPVGFQNRLGATTIAPSSSGSGLTLLPTLEHDGFYYALLEKR